MAATDDVMQAFVAKWTADTALNASFAGGPRAGDIPSPLVVPYAHIETRVEKEPTLGSGGTGCHYIRTVLQVWGKKADANTIIGQIAATFENASNTGGTGSKTLTVPNSTHLWTQPINPGSLEKAETRKDGEEIWKGIVEYVVWVQRLTP